MNFVKHGFSGYRGGPEPFHISGPHCIGFLSLCQYVSVFGVRGSLAPCVRATVHVRVTSHCHPGYVNWFALCFSSHSIICMENVFFRRISIIKESRMTTSVGSLFRSVWRCQQFGMFPDVMPMLPH